MPNPKDYPTLPKCSGCGEHHPTPEWAEQHPKEADRWAAESMAEEDAKLTPEQRAIHEGRTEHQLDAYDRLNHMAGHLQELTATAMQLKIDREKATDKDEIELLDAQLEQNKRHCHALSLHCNGIIGNTSDWCVLSMGLSRDNEDQVLEGASIQCLLLARKCVTNEDHPEGYEYVIAGQVVNQAFLDKAFAEGGTIDDLADAIISQVTVGPTKHTIAEAFALYMGRAPILAQAMLKEKGLAKFLITAHPSRDNFLKTNPSFASRVQCGVDVAHLVHTVSPEEVNALSPEEVHGLHVSIVPLSAMVIGSQGNPAAGAAGVIKMRQGTVSAVTDILDASVEDILALAKKKSADFTEEGATSSAISDRVVAETKGVPSLLLKLGQ